MQIEAELPHQRAVLRALLKLTMPAGVIYVALVLLRGDYLLGFCEAILTGGAIYCYRRLDRVKNVHYVAVAFTVSLLGILVYSLFRPESSSTMFVWMFVAPILCYTVTGAKAGFRLTSGFYIVILLEFLRENWQNLVIQEPIALLNIVVCVIGIWVFAHIYESIRLKSQAELEQLASRDPLTGLYNRLRLSSFFNKASRKVDLGSNCTVGIVMLDLDHFKAINDQYGHAGGDAVLCCVAEQLLLSLRPRDTAFRLGGEEFCIIIARTNKGVLVEIAERLRANIQALDVEFEGTVIRITSSVGCAVLDSSVTTLDALISIADSRLYDAKQHGRNRVVFDDSYSNDQVSSRA